jgi:hypothetical protein
VAVLLAVLPEQPSAVLSLPASNAYAWCALLAVAVLYQKTGEIVTSESLLKREEEELLGYGYLKNIIQ